MRSFAVLLVLLCISFPVQANPDPPLNPPPPPKKGCDNDYFCAPDFGNFGGSTVLGLAMSFAGNFVNSVGYILQKIGYRHLMKTQEVDPDASIVKEPYWVIGFVTYAVGSLTHGAALGFASQALLVPMEGVTLVANAFLAPVFLGEKLGKMELIGSAVCCVGIVTTVLFGPNSEQEFTTTDLLEFYITPQFLVYGILQCSAGVVSWLFLQIVQRKNKKEGVVYDGTDGTMIKPRARRTALLHVSIAGILAAFNVLFLKTVSTIFLNSPEPASERFALPWPYMFFVLFVLCNFSMEVWKQRALQQFESVYIVPVFQAALIVLAVLTGGGYFKEFNDMKPVNLLIFGSGLSIVAGGVFCLAFEMESKLGKILHDKILPRLRVLKAFGMKPEDIGRLSAEQQADIGGATVYPVEDPDLHPLPAVPSLGISMGGSKNPSRAHSVSHSAKNSRRASVATEGTAVIARANSDCAIKMGKSDSANDSSACSPKQELPSKQPDGAAAAAIPQMGNSSDKDDQQRPVRKSSYLLDPIKPRDTDQLKVDTGGTDQLEVSDVSEGSPTK